MDYTGCDRVEAIDAIEEFNGDHNRILRYFADLQGGWSNMPGRARGRVRNSEHINRAFDNRGPTSSLGDIGKSESNIAVNYQGVIGTLDNQTHRLQQPVIQITKELGKCDSSDKVASGVLVGKKRSLGFTETTVVSIRPPYKPLNTTTTAASNHPSGQVVPLGVEQDRVTNHQSANPFRQKYRRLYAELDKLSNHRN
uniref:Uncharacterized protein n=1 Tax=Panagrolaimus superbus TaxID=310955 RepID=A0A914XT92_9BILA